MRNVRILGLALLAMFSIGAVASASASADTLTATGYPALLTGAADEGFVNVISTTAGSAKCPETKYDATITGPVTTAGSISINATFSDTTCSAFGFPATVDTNGCIFQLSILAGTNGDVDLECGAGKEVTVTAFAAGTSKCTAHLPTQTDIGGTVKLKNIVSGGTVEADLSGVDYTHTQGTGLGACASGSGTTGTLSLKAVFSAESESGVSTLLALS